MGWTRRRSCSLVCVLAILVAATVGAQNPPSRSDGGDLPPQFAEIVRIQLIVLELLPQIFADNPDLDFYCPLPFSHSSSRFQRSRSMKSPAFCPGRCSSGWPDFSS